jgi:protein-disulfide isomerase
MKNGLVLLIITSAAVLGLVTGRLSTPAKPTDEPARIVARPPPPAPRLARPAPNTPPPSIARDDAQPPHAPPAGARAPKPAQGERRSVVVAPDDATWGPPSARVTLVEFSDFQCPYCARATPTLKRIKEEYGDQVRIVFKHHPLPFHKDAPLASQAAIEAHAQGKFWEFHDRLFGDVKSIKREHLEAHAQALGLDMAQFRGALDSGVHAAKVERDAGEAQALGASGTPAFFVNGRFLSGAQPFESFKALIDEELGA